MSANGYPPSYGEVSARLGHAREFHSKQDRWERPDAGGSFESKAEADEWDEYEDGLEATVGFAICAECGRIEAEAHEDDDEWGYRESIWPCRTALALGAIA